MLADSYKNAEIISSFTKDGKAYARIKMKCDRCGGRGIFAINGICYKCSGSGFAIEEVRDYTEVEYERMQRAKVKRREEHNLRLLNRHGFNGIHAYAIVGNTYELKEELKAHGAKFSYELLWVSPEEPTWLPTDRYVKICVSDVFEMHDDVLCIKDSATSFINSLQPKSGEHLGTIGQRLKVTVTIAKRFEYDTEYVKGRPTTSYKYIMKTDDGNTVTWSTSAVYWKEGYKCAIIGTVKDHAEYKGVRQTVLTRCKEVKDELD